MLQAVSLFPAGLQTKKPQQASEMQKIPLKALAFSMINFLYISVSLKYIFHPQHSPKRTIHSKFPSLDMENWKLKSRIS